jgi:hypothetical protein
MLQAEAQLVTPLWTEVPQSYPGGWEHDFCLWRDAVLVWKGQGFAANNAAGVEFLTVHQGEIIEVKVDLGSWALNIRADGAGEIGVYNTYDATARVPARTFDFRVVRERLLAVSDSERETVNAPRVFFIRNGQTSFRSRRVRDTQLVAELYTAALRAAVDRQPGFDRHLKDQPPVGTSAG